MVSRGPGCIPADQLDQLSVVIIVYISNYTVVNTSKYRQIALHITNSYRLTTQLKALGNSPESLRLLRLTSFHQPVFSASATMSAYELKLHGDSILLTPPPPFPQDPPL